MRVLRWGLMVRSLILRRVALIALLAAPLPAVAPWCDVWCASAHHADGTTALAEPPSSEHDHCLNLAQDAAAPSTVIEGVRVPSLTEPPSVTCEALATAVLTSAPKGPETPTAVVRIDAFAMAGVRGRHRPALTAAGPAPPLIPAVRSLALRL